MRSALRSVGLACEFLLIVGLMPSPASAQSDKSNSQLKAINERVLELYRTGKFAEAIPLAERYADAVKARHGARHAEYAASLHNLAHLLMAANRSSEAEPLMRQALGIYEKALGTDHPSVAVTLKSLGDLSLTTNRPQEAERLYCRALEVQQKHLGPDHAETLDDLALSLQFTGRLAEAEATCRRALAIKERNVGGDHIAVARTLTRLASILAATSRPAEAEQLYRRALTIQETSLGSDHPTVGSNLISLAGLLSNLNRSAEAEPLYRRALAINEKNFGPDDARAEIINTLNGFALMLQETGRSTEAEAIYRDGLLTASEVAQLQLSTRFGWFSRLATPQPVTKAMPRYSQACARGFFYAKARALLVSHWYVNSEAAVKLTTGALEEVSRAPRLGRAEALRRSMARLITAGRPDEAHPGSSGAVGPGRRRRQPFLNVSISSADQLACRAQKAADVTPLIGGLFRPPTVPVVAVLASARRSPPAPCMRHTVQPLTAGEQHDSPVAFAVAEHLGASGRPDMFGYRFMRSMLHFFLHPSPGRDITDNGLAAGMDVEVLHIHGLLASRSMLFQRFHLHRECARQLLQAGRGAILLLNGVDLFQAPRDLDGGLVDCRHLHGEQGFDSIFGFDATDDCQQVIELALVRITSPRAHLT